MSFSKRIIPVATLALFVGISLFTSIGCGKKTPPVPPEAASPISVDAANN